jgi:3-oxoacyl-[acyl-carrier protein] reductase
MVFHNKTVIITGANSGIGREIAIAFGRKKANVVVNYISNEPAADKVVNAILEAGGQAIKFAADVTDLKACQEMVKTTKETFKTVDVLVNNSGITKDNLIIRMKEMDFDQVIDVNLKGAWNMSKSVARIMMKQKSGAIINIASVVGIIGNAGQSNYVASKAGLIGLTKSLSKELGVRGIRVNAVAPGFIQTAMTDQLSEAVKRDYLKQIPLNAFGEAKDVAHAAMFLASEEANYITGQTLSVNGGMIG